ncbi:unnamed protein product [Eruca vesicaria subsp. sativa]|uniref:FLZ-type domain-containing protein n=1 Tax=Eruca vesicaria subsp. sativa TaxID=29727 RepID=A0ABC8J4M7_ERUVS|nr:unnamed protein product [Eruca vesicaria subsp. sativa]
MVLGKRHGSLIKRTTSMLMITDDIATIDDHASQPYDYLTLHHHHRNPTVVMATNNDDDFLRTCSLCNRILCHRRDIYMYRGDNAFCSLECREKQIMLDERKVKTVVRSSKKHIRI